MADREGVWLVPLTQDEMEVIDYCINYASERDDEGIRSSDPRAVRRTMLLDSVTAKLWERMQPREEPDEEPHDD